MNISHYQRTAVDLQFHSNASWRWEIKCCKEQREQIRAEVMEEKKIVKWDRQVESTKNANSNFKKWKIKLFGKRNHVKCMAVCVLYVCYHDGNTIFFTVSIFEPSHTLTSRLNCAGKQFKWTRMMIRFCVHT